MNAGNPKEKSRRIQPNVDFAFRKRRKQLSGGQRKLKLFYYFTQENKTRRHKNNITQVPSAFSCHEYPLLFSTQTLLGIQIYDCCFDDSGEVNPLACFWLARLSLKEKNQKTLQKCALLMATPGFCISLIILSPCPPSVQLGLTYFVPSLWSFA